MVLQLGSSDHVLDGAKLESLASRSTTVRENTPGFKYAGPLGDTQIQPCLLYRTTQWQVAY